MNTPPIPTNNAGMTSGPRMVLIQTLAILLDAYRDIQSRKLFWITLILSGVGVLAMSAVGFNERGISVLGYTFEVGFLSTKVMSAADWYKTMFLTLGVQQWLGWIAIILALVSTAPMFPDFLSGGSVDLYLARPLGRLRLFLTKYSAGLLFVALQVSVFCLASFFVIGIRAGAWLPGIFLAIPLVALLFSYLWSVCALLGVLTRSTITAVLLTLLLWMGVFGVHSTESALLFFKVGNQVERKDLTSRVASLQAEVARLTTRPATPATTQPSTRDALRLTRVQNNLNTATARLTEVSNSKVARWHAAFYAIKWPLPKTAETTALLERVLKVQIETDTRLDNSPAADEAPLRNFMNDNRLQRLAAEEVDRAIQSRSVFWVLGTSLAFEALMLALAAWIFARRDF
jgi:ABC-type transport system involved in multi-copper enzyme maturation permease subunit